MILLILWQARLKDSLFVMVFKDSFINNHFICSLSSLFNCVCWFKAVFCHEVSGFLEPLPAFCRCQRSQLFPHIDLLEAFKSGFSQEERSIHPNHCWLSSSELMGSTQIKADKSQKQWYHISAIFLSKWCFDPNNHYQSREQSRPVWGFFSVGALNTHYTSNATCLNKTCSCPPVTPRMLTLLSLLWLYV